MADESAIGRIINAVPASEAELLAFMARCEVASDDTLPIIGTLFMNGCRLEAVGANLYACHMGDGQFDVSSGE